MVTRLVAMQGTEVDVEDVKRVYSLFLDEHRSTVFLQVSLPLHAGYSQAVHNLYMSLYKVWVW